MRVLRRPLRSLLTATALAGVVVLWLLFAPIEIGGPAAYAVINGNSMEPGLHRGDLVVLHQTDDYQVGDIVTYRHPTVGRVIHRIVAVADDRFVLKGDNNTWLDSYQPSQAEVIGKFWLYAPSVGKIVEQVRQPWTAAFLVSVGGLAIIASFQADMARTRDRRRVQKTPGKRRVVTESTRGSQADLVFLFAALGLAWLLLGIFAFTRPVMRTTFTDVKYQHTGVFSYTAAAPPGIYDGNTVKTGQPIFRRLIAQASLAFDYRLQAEPVETLTGVARLNAVLSSNNGWRSEIPLQGEVPFQGSSVHLQGTLDLARIQALLDDLQQQTGVATAQYTLVVAPAITISGTLAGQALQDAFAPQLVFTLDELQMQLVAQQKSPGDNSDALRPSENRLVRKASQVTNTIVFLGLPITIPLARGIAAGGLILTLVGAAVAVLAGHGTLARSEEGYIRAKYGALLINVCESDLLHNHRRVTVASVDDLAKIAERTGRMILHQSGGDGHIYIVQDNDIAYCYRIADAARVAHLPVSGEL